MKYLVQMTSSLPVTKLAFFLSN